MSPKQKIFFTQLQLASIGLLILVFGLIWKNGWLMAFGGCVILYGLIRWLLLKNLVEEDIDQQELPDDLSIQDFRIRSFKWVEEKEDDEDF